MDANVSGGVNSQPEVFEVLAHPIKCTFVENFRFTIAEDKPFALEMSSESVYNLLYKNINEKKYTKASESTSLIEVLTTGI